MENISWNNTSVKFKDVIIPAPWGHIAGRWYGSRSERPILAIHGWMDNLGTFDRLVPLLLNHTAVLCIDLPGHGRSSRLPRGIYYSVYDYVYTIPLVMKAFGWPKVSLMGHSLGGVMSFMYAGMAPDTVDLVVSLDVLLPRRITDPGKLSSDIEKWLEEERQQAEGLEPHSFTLSKLRSIIDKGSNKSVPLHLADHLLHRQIARSQIYPEKLFLSRDGRVKFYNIFDIEPGLAAVIAGRIRPKPYLIIKGSLSQFVGLQCEDTISILSQDNPHFELHNIAGASHHVHLQAPEECARHIVPFILAHRSPTNGTIRNKELSKL